MRWQAGITLPGLCSHAHAREGEDLFSNDDGAARYTPAPGFTTFKDFFVCFLLGIALIFGGVAGLLRYFLSPFL
jgi:hypothetical protein